MNTDSDKQILTHGIKIKTKAKHYQTHTKTTVPPIPPLIQKTIQKSTKNTIQTILNQII